MEFRFITPVSRDLGTFGMKTTPPVKRLCSGNLPKKHNERRNC